jgi:Skp family chaperone for outer membrane proteins
VLNVRSSLRYAAVAAVILSLGAAVGSAQAQTPGTNVAVLDVPYVFKHHAQFQQNIEVIKKDIEDFKQWMLQEQQRMRTEAEKLEQYKPGSAEYKAQEEQMARDSVNIKLEAAKRQKVFMEREAQEYYETFQEIQEVVAQFAVHNKIGLVLRYSAEEMDPMKRESIMQAINDLVIYQDRLNITKFIVDALNNNNLADRHSPTIPSGGGLR